jgi:hypothetical protein
MEGILIRIEDTCKERVLEGDILFMQRLWLNGKTVEWIAEAFNVPADWVEDFVMG